MNACDEILVDQLVHFVEGFQYRIGRDVDLTRAVHDEDGISLATLEQPLSFDKCIGDTWGIPVVVRTPSIRPCRGAGLLESRTLLCPHSSSEIWLPERR